MTASVADRAVVVRSRRRSLGRWRRLRLFGLQPSERRVVLLEKLAQPVAVDEVDRWCAVAGGFALGVGMVKPVLISRPLSPRPAIAPRKSRTAPTPRCSDRAAGRPHRPARDRPRAWTAQPLRRRPGHRRHAADRRGDRPERLRSEAAWAHMCAVAPIPAASGKTRRHRLNRGGNREANHALWRIVITRMSAHRATRAYVKRRTAEGMSKKEIIRCLKRYVAREVYPHLRG